MRSVGVKLIDLIPGGDGLSRKQSCLGRLLLIIIIVGLLAAGILLYFGYRNYREAVEEIPLREKIAQIQSNPDYVTIDGSAVIFRGPLLP